VLVIFKTPFTIISSKVQSLKKVQAFKTKQETSKVQKKISNSCSRP